jgi:hypothetical protein
MVVWGQMEREKRCTGGIWRKQEDGRGDAREERRWNCFSPFSIRKTKQRGIQRRFALSMFSIAELTAQRRGVASVLESQVCEQAIVEGTQLGCITPRFFATAILPLMRMGERWFDTRNPTRALAVLSRFKAAEDGDTTHRSTLHASPASSCSSDAMCIVLSMLSVSDFVVAQRVCHRWHALRLRSQAWPLGPMAPYVSMLESDDVSVQLWCLHRLHAVVAIFNLPFWEKCITRISELVFSMDESVQDMALRVLVSLCVDTNDDADVYSQYIIGTDITDKLVSLLVKVPAKGNVADLIATLLCNMYAGAHTRVDVLAKYLPVFLRLLFLRQYRDTLHSTTSLVNNMCRKLGSVMDAALPSLCTLLMECDDTITLTFVCKALQALYMRNASLVSHAALARLVVLAVHPQKSIAQAAAHALVTAMMIPDVATLVDLLIQHVTVAQTPIADVLWTWALSHRTHVTPVASVHVHDDDDAADDFVALQSLLHVAKWGDAAFSYMKDAHKVAWAQILRKRA